MKNLGCDHDQHSKSTLISFTDMKERFTTTFWDDFFFNVVVVVVVVVDTMASMSMLSE